MKKKILALVLTMSLLLTSVCIGVSGAEIADEDLNDVQTTAEEMLSERGAGDLDYKIVENSAVKLEKNAMWSNNERTEASLNIVVTPKTISQSTDAPVDVVFLADISESMAGDRITKEKEGLIAAAKDVVDRNANSRVSLVSFSTGANIKVGFTRDLTQFNSAVNTLAVDGLTDYGIGYTRVKDVIDGRTDTSNALRVAFISDGLPTAGLDTAKRIKNQIKAISGSKIIGLQYMLGDSVEKDFSDVVDEVHVINSVNSFVGVLRDSIVEYSSSSGLKSVVVNDAISQHFNVANVKSITVSKGSVSLSGKNIVWTVGDLYGTARMNVKLNFAYSDDREGDFETNNNKASVEYIGGMLDVESPVLGRHRYSVSYVVDSELGKAPVDNNKYWPGEEVTYLDIAEDNPADDQIFRFWDGKCHAGDTFSMPTGNKYCYASFYAVPSVTKTAEATNPVNANWLPLVGNWYYMVSPTDSSVLKLKYTDGLYGGCFGSTECSALNNLDASNDIDLASLKTYEFYGGANSFNFAGLYGSSVQNVRGRTSSYYFQFADKSNYDLSAFPAVECLDFSNINLESSNHNYDNEMYLSCGRYGTTIWGPNSYPSEYISSLANLKTCILPPSIEKLSGTGRTYTSGMEYSTSGFIYDTPFAGCISLETVENTEGIKRFYTTNPSYYFYQASDKTYVDYSPFLACSSLRELDLSSLEEIPKNFAQYCSSLEKVTLSSETTKIQEYAFYSCSSLADINLGDTKVNTLSNWAFYRCSSLASINIPNTLTTIGTNVFYDCSNLKSIDLPSSVSRIGSGAFAYDTDIEATIRCKDVVIDTNAFNTRATIYGYDDGAAKVYANSKSNITYVSLGATTPSASTSSIPTVPSARAQSNDVELSDVNIADITPNGDSSGAITYGQVDEGATIDYTLTIKGPRCTEVTTGFKHNVLTIKDKLPEGLTLVDGSIKVSPYAVVAANYDPNDANNSYRTYGQIIKQNGEDYSIDADGAIIVKIAGLESIGLMTITFTCTVDDLPDGLMHRDYYNTATVQEQNVVKVSNVTYHYVDKNTDQSNLPKNVSYQYVGTVPASAVTPAAESHAVNDSVTVANYTDVTGYRFEGWTFYGEDGTVFDTTTARASARGADAGSSFKMPDQNLRAIGTYSANVVPTPTEVVVSYEFDGDVPTAKIGTEPAPAMIASGNTATIAAYPSAVDGYYFQGWTINGTVYEAGSKTPALTKDTVVRGNWVKLSTGDEPSTGDDEAPRYYTVTVNYRNAPSGFTSQTFVYAAGEDVTLPEVTNVPTSHIFDGYISDDVYVKDGEFTMPEKNVVVTGIFVDASKATPEQPVDDTYTLVFSYNDHGADTYYYQILEDYTSSTYTLTSAPITEPYTGSSNVGTSVDGVPTNEKNLFAGWFKTVAATEYYSITSSSITNNIDRSQAFGTTVDLTQCTVEPSKVINGETYTNVITFYAAFVKPYNVSIDSNDKNNYSTSKLNGFNLEGVQIRSKEVADKYQNSERNTDQDALRFVTVYRNNMLTDLKNLNNKPVTYGYTVYGKDNVASLTSLDKKTTGAVDVDCTQEGDHNHRMFTNYRLSTLVVKYDGTDSQYKGNLIEARAYVDYTDANGFARRGYNTYSDSKFAGGCRTSFNSAWSAVSQAYNALAKIA